jgi:Tol biopolymer transport system component
MPLTAGTRLGRYEILSQLGAGGMGEVYRAKDTQLDRQVAIKVLPKQTASDPDALARFDREAKAVAALSHPNVLGVFDFSTQDHVAYAVMELLEGESLRARIAAGPLPARRAVEIALQICQGLGAAHEKGIVHRDLKPENIFITKDNRIKILDFGLAKHVHVKSETERETVEYGAGTEKGTILGTVGYMSPEQVRGEDVDARSDIFSFGAVLYEMLSGRRAFKADSAIETMSAILKQDPPELVETNQNVNPALERIVRHCLEKQPDARFQSARDLAFQLETLSGVSTTSASGLGHAGPLPRATRRVPWPLLAIPLGLGLAIGAGVALRWRAHAPLPLYQQLTFQSGTISQARFAPDDETIVYSAAWSSHPVEVLTTRRESPESRGLQLAQSGLFSVSREGELAIAEGCEFFMGACHGTLARVPLSGGAPREMLKDIHAADWAPKGDDLAIVREMGGRTRLEYPVGQVLYEAPGWISHVRFSPSGDSIAFIDHPMAGDDGGAITIVDRAGKARVLADGWGSAWGLAWHPSGREIWFTAAETGLVQALRAVDLKGRQRVVLRTPSRLILQDISKTGRVLFSRETARGGLMFASGDGKKEQDLSWFDWSFMAHVSDDAKTVLFGERGEGTRGVATIYMRGTNGSAAVNLGEGRPLALSRDGAWVLAAPAPDKLRLLPTGVGDPRDVSAAPLARVMRAAWFPRSNRVLLLASEKGHPRRCYVLDLDKGGAPLPVSVEGKSIEFLGQPVSPDEKMFAATDASGRIALHPVDGGEPRILSELPKGTVPMRWSPDGASLFVYRRESLPAQILRVDLATQAVTPWKELMPGDTTGIVRVPNVDLSADGRSYVYTYSQRLSELYLAEGLR